MSPAVGHDETAVRKKRRVEGPNSIESRGKRSTLSILLSQIQNAVSLLLAAAAIVSLAFGHGVEGITILAALFINVVIGFITELRANRSLEALGRMGTVRCRVKRNGRGVTVPARDLVRGDIVEPAAGDIVPADIRLLECRGIQADESALTGESVRVGKTGEVLPEDTPLHSRTNMLLRGTAVVKGEATGIVTAVGMDTELGKISQMAETAEEEVSPLERRLNNLATRLMMLAGGVTALVGLSGYLRGKDILLMLRTAVALAVAAIPEGLPVVATIALARGMWRMARRNALITRLGAVETLGACTVICTDKTGTLTENRMRVADIVIAGAQQGGAPVGVAVDNDRQEGGEVPPEENGHSGAIRELARLGVLCNDADLGAEESSREQGDPLETALLRFGRRFQLERRELLREAPERRQESFDTATKMMATYHDETEGITVAVKGAPEAVLQRCTEVHIGSREGVRFDENLKNAWLSRADEMASHGLRVLAVARKTAGSVDENPYEALVLLGLTGLEDPPRREVPAALRSCRGAGVNVTMVTGDHPRTARAIGKSIGLLEGKEDGVATGEELEQHSSSPDEARKWIRDKKVLARMSPRHKLTLIELLQKNSAITAMTGDGVNDAPALKKADIGIAMGEGGTQVAREAADMVLRDNSFAAIVEAIEEGRTIFANIRRFVIYLLSGNLSEIMIVGAALLIAGVLPILPLQVLYLNMLCDVFPALALGVGGREAYLMHRPPRNPLESVLTPSHWALTTGFGVLLALVVLSAFFAARGPLGLEPDGAVTVAFLTLGFARLGHVFNMRSHHSGLRDNNVVTNPFVWGALLLCSALLLLTVFLPVLRTVLNVTHPSPGGWLVILSFALIPFVFVQAVYGILGRRTRPDGTEEARADARPGGAVSNAGDRRRMDSKTNEGRQR